MKNFEKHKKDILNLVNVGCNSICVVSEEIKPCTSSNCKKCKFFNAENCHAEFTKWLYEDANEVDWSSVKIDAKILVRDGSEQFWTPAHFAGYDHGIFYAYRDGRTSFTETITYPWHYAKLAEETGGGD